MRKINPRLIIFLTLAAVLAVSPLVLADPNTDNSQFLNRTTDSSNQTEREATEDKLIANDIFFYDPDQDACDTTFTDTAAAGTAQENIKTALQYLTSKGFTLAQAAGIAGNISHESSFNPLSVEGPSKYNNHSCPDKLGTRGMNAISIEEKYPEAVTQGARWYIGKANKPGYGSGGGNCGNCGIGLMGWTYNSCDPNGGGYLSNLDDFAKATNRKWYDLTLQLDFIIITISKPHGAYNLEGLLATTTPEDAALYFHDGWERSAGGGERRKPTARKLYDQYYGVIPDGSGHVERMSLPSAGDASSGSTGSDPCPPATIGGDLRTMVTQLAWPLNCPGSGTTKSEGNLMCKAAEPTPAYAEAVKRQRAAGKYTGANNGQDCGGWVSILLNQSGFDPDYNSKKQGVNGVFLQIQQSDKWTLLNNQYQVIDTAILQPGDVSFQGPSPQNIREGNNYIGRHTFVYVGEIPNFKSKIASASYSGSHGVLVHKHGRFPMAGREALTQYNGHVIIWARKVK